MVAKATSAKRLLSIVKMRFSLGDAANDFWFDERGLHSGFESAHSVKRLDEAGTKSHAICATQFCASALG